jgi:hypothetical protein
MHGAAGAVAVTGRQTIREFYSAEFRLGGRISLFPKML